VDQHQVATVYKWTRQNLSLSLPPSVPLYIYVYTPGHTNTNKSVLSKEVSKSNFRQYGQMKSRDGKNQKRREEKRRSRKCGVWSTFRS
jgi:hypothetical protein